MDAHVGGPREPGVEDVDAADGVRPQQGVSERRVVVEPQALPEPVDAVSDHFSTFPYRIKKKRRKKKEVGRMQKSKEQLAATRLRFVAATQSLRVNPAPTEPPP